ncbi:hypothetical protein [Sulfobacillus thermosulfidooxidans]|uniref:hypothetical protein n=1 Tax=Sulfobacillus thermosulfidooxidans TaxID=28034 RepID=UPI0006B65C7F|nr:hypothetical protein [Sulfobacillus thermosulfidooxidans]
MPRVLWSVDAHRLPWHTLALTRRAIEAACGTPPSGCVLVDMVIPGHHDADAVRTVNLIGDADDIHHRHYADAVQRFVNQTPDVL